MKLETYMFFLQTQTSPKIAESLVPSQKLPTDSDSNLILSEQGIKRSINPVLNAISEVRFRKLDM